MTTVYKCARCKSVKSEDEFEVKNERRIKTCKDCDKYKSEWNKTKREFHFKLDKNEWHQWKGNIYCNKLGLVINKKTKKLIGGLEVDGYIRVSWQDDDGKINHTSVHHIIYETFVDEIPEGKIINHIDENKSNNNLENLELETPSGNSQKSSKKVSEGQRKPMKCFGKKLNEEDWIEYKSLSDASRKLGICPQSIQSVCDGIYNTTTSKLNGEKYIFKYYLGL